MRPLWKHRSFAKRSTVAAISDRRTSWGSNICEFLKSTVTERRYNKRKKALRFGSASLSNQIRPG